MSKTGIFSSFHLKAAMCVLMVLDHIYRHFPGTPYVLHQFGRIVMPLFAFLIAQGMVHTRSRRGYIMRLFGFGMATMLGGAVIASFFEGAVFRYNILISFAIAAQIIVSIDTYKSDDAKLRWIVMAAVLALVALFFEGAWMVTAPVLIFYYLRDRPLLMYTAYAVSVIPVIWLMSMVLSVTRGISVYMPSQWLMIFGIIPIMLYNGRRGTHGRSGVFFKYAFYMFYPVHLWILFLISNLIYRR